MLCNKPAPLCKTIFNEKNQKQKTKKTPTASKFKEEKIQKTVMIKVIFITLAKNKEHVGYHRAHYTHKSHIQVQTQR